MPTCSTDCNRLSPLLRVAKTVKINTHLHCGPGDLGTERSGRVNYLKRMKREGAHKSWPVSMISVNSSGDMGDVNEGPHATAQGGPLRDVLVNVLGEKKRKVHTLRSDNIVIPEKLTPRNSNKAPKKSGERVGKAHVKQTHQQSHRFRVKASSSPSKIFYLTPLLGKRIAAVVGHFPDTIMWSHRTCALCVHHNSITHRPAGGVVY